jgi:hypothetical protein
MRFLKLWRTGGRQNLDTEDMSPLSKLSAKTMICEGLLFVLCEIYI